MTSSQPEPQADEDLDEGWELDEPNTATPARSAAPATGAESLDPQSVDAEWDSLVPAPLPRPTAAPATTEQVAASAEVAAPAQAPRLPQVRPAQPEKASAQRPAATEPEKLQPRVVGSGVPVPSLGVSASKAKKQLERAKRQARAKARREEAKRGKRREQRKALERARVQQKPEASGSAVRATEQGAAPADPAPTTPPKAKVAPRKQARPKRNASARTAPAPQARRALAQSSQVQAARAPAAQRLNWPLLLGITLILALVVAAVWFIAKAPQR